jgi:hypothetical protein
MSYQPSVPRSIVDTGNSTTNPLAGSPGPGDVFTGSWQEVVEYQSISVLVEGSAASTAPGTLKLQFSQDGVAVAREITINESDITSVTPRTLGVIAQYFRVVYENGLVAQLTLNIQTLLHSSQVELVSRLNQSLDGDEDVQNTRSVITGEDPDGAFKNVLVSRSGNLDVTIGDANDLYSTRVSPAQSLKVANQTNLVGAAFDSSPLNATQWQTNFLLSGTINNSDGEISVETGGVADSMISLRSRDLARFVPANFNVSHTAIQMPNLTTLPGTGTNTVHWGPFIPDPTSGLPLDGALFKVVRQAGSGGQVWYAETYKSGIVTNSIISSSWNNSEGLAYFNDNVIDNLNTNVFEIEYNAGTVVWRVNNRTVNTSATLNTPYSDGVNLPITVSNVNSGGCSTAYRVKLRANAIYTLGKGESVPRAFFNTYSASGATLIKTGPGKLERVVIARDGGGAGTTEVDIYDDTSAVGSSQIGKILLLADETKEIEYDVNFNNGLFVDVNGAGGSSNFVTVTYD